MLQTRNSVVYLVRFCIECETIGLVKIEKVIRHQKTKKQKKNEAMRTYPLASPSNLFKATLGDDYKLYWVAGCTRRELWLLQTKQIYGICKKAIFPSVTFALLEKTPPGSVLLHRKKKRNADNKHSISDTKLKESFQIIWRKIIYTATLSDMVHNWTAEEKSRDSNYGA